MSSRKPAISDGAKIGLVIVIVLIAGVIAYSCGLGTLAAMIP